jgi:hypothetical protein
MTAYPRVHGRCVESGVSRDISAVGCRSTRSTKESDEEGIDRTQDICLAVHRGGLLFSLAVALPYSPDDPTPPGMRATWSVLMVVFVLAGIGLSLLECRRNLAGGRSGCESLLGQLESQIDKRQQAVGIMWSLAEPFAGPQSDVLAPIEAMGLGMGSAGGCDMSREARKSYAPAFLVVQEVLPGLDTNEAFSRLLRELEDIEDEIAKTCTQLGGVVTEYHTQLTTLPRSMAARLFGFASLERI